jgi:hypothetical protein
VSKRTIKLADLLKDAASPLRAPADPKILLGVLDDASDLSGLSVWHSYFHEIIAVVLLVVTLGAGFAFMPELSRRLPVRTALPLQMWNGILVVPVEINGAMTLDFAVDSGGLCQCARGCLFYVEARRHHSRGGSSWARGV